jgi:hypothetical protein
MTENNIPLGYPVLSEAELSSIRLENKRLQEESEAYGQELIDARNAKIEIINEPLAPLPITGSTVADVKESAEASIADLATQMQAKIDAISGL